MVMEAQSCAHNLMRRDDYVRVVFRGEGRRRPPSNDP